MLVLKCYLVVDLDLDLECGGGRISFTQGPTDAVLHQLTNGDILSVLHGLAFIIMERFGVS